MTRLIDKHNMLEIEMILFDGTNRSPDWSNDFFNVGSLKYNQDFDAYEVEDIDYCMEQAQDWEFFQGDFADDIEEEGKERITYCEFWRYK